MEFVIVVVAFMAVAAGITGWFRYSDARYKKQYKPRWVQHGRDDARWNARRMVLTAQWLQEFYDEGYDAVINEKEAANV